MNGDRVFFYIALAVIFAITTMITSCTISVSMCRSEAIKAGVPPEKINLLCRA